MSIPPLPHHNPLNHIPIPIIDKLFIGLIDEDCCPKCLHKLREQPVCPHCGYDVEGFLSTPVTE
jgi:hypothetical protein